jgi:predicted AAA+ superfamily ATPase
VFRKGNSPRRICEELSVLFETPIEPGKTLLFLDEIQGSLEAISSLRYFYEEMPALHVVAAGSLLEFALQELPSFGVGRIRSLFLYPFSFQEYLHALGEVRLAHAIAEATPQAPLAPSLHQKAKEHLVRFITLGGMPEVVAAYASGTSLLECQSILDDLILSFSTDFAKYKARVPVARLREVFASVMEQTGSKFVYSRATQDATHAQIKESVALLEMAGLVFPVTHTAANGLPLAAEENQKFRKYLVFDTGIYQRHLRLDLGSILLGDTLAQVNKGGLAELFVGLELLKATPSNQFGALHYWQREAAGASAEVDFVVQRGSDIIPLEVKAGTKGAMQSMQIFLKEKRSPYGIRCSLENFGTIQNETGNILVYPLYAAGGI